MEVTKLEYYPYTLTPKFAPNRLTEATPRSGALLRVWFSDCSLPGHADLFPWPELGDMPLQLQLETLKERIPLPLAASSLLWAHHEAKAHASGEEFFPGTSLPSHLTALDRAAIPHGTPLVKLKVTEEDVQNWPQVEALMERFPETRWRLDFNGLFTDMDRAYDSWNKLSHEAQDKIDFIEDPMDEKHMAHEDIHQVFPGATIAVDRNPYPASLRRAEVWVIKPVNFAPDVFLREAMDFEGKIVITSSMDHPLGQLMALRAAQLLQRRSPRKVLAGGLCTQDLYLDHPQKNWVRTDNSCLRAALTDGAGWGLSHALGKLKWQELA